MGGTYGILDYKNCLTLILKPEFQME